MTIKLADSYGFVGASKELYKCVMKQENSIDEEDVDYERDYSQPYGEYAFERYGCELYQREGWGEELQQVQSGEVVYCQRSARLFTR